MEKVTKSCDMKSIYQIMHKDTLTRPCMKVLLPLPMPKKRFKKIKNVERSNQWGSCMVREFICRISRNMSDWE